MKNRDKALIALAITAVFLLSECTSSPSTTTYGAEFTEISDSPITKEGYVPEGKTLNIVINATTKNITKVSVQLAFYDDSGDGCTDVMGLEVDSPFPNALYLPQQWLEADKTLVINVTIQQVPKEKTGDSKAKLQDYLDGITNTQGSGKWTISVTDVDAQPNCPSPKAPDAGNSWVLLISPYHFTGNITKLGS